MVNKKQNDIEELTMNEDLDDELEDIINHNLLSL